MCLPGSLMAAMVAVLVGTAALAQPREARREKKERVILLKGDDVQPRQVLQVAPDAATLVMFDTPVVRESVDISALQEWFERAEVTERSLVLRPAAELPEAVRLTLTVRFADGKAPRGVVFALTSPPDVVDTQVEVLRESKSQAQLVSELAALRGRCAVTEAGLAPLRARCARAGLAGLFVSGELAPAEGVVARRMDVRATASGLREAKNATVFRTGNTVMVGLWLENPPGQRRWMPGPARLVRLGEDGQPLEEARMLPVLLSEERMEPGAQVLAAVQWEEPLGAPAVAVRLEVEGSDGRGLRWEWLDVRKPDSSRGHGKEAAWAR